MKIVITGGRGFVGKALSKKFRNSEHIIHTIGRSSHFTKSDFPENCQHHCCDLANDPIPEDIFKGTDLIFHIAAKAGMWGKYSDFYSSNVIATRNILSACKKYHINKLIYTSTPSVVFSTQPIVNGTESLAYGNSGLSSYAETKTIAEREILEANESQKLQTLALRPHLIWGDEDPHLLPRVINRHKKGKLQIVGEGRNKVDLTHVDNVVHAHFCAMESMVKNSSLGGKAYFIGQDEPVNLWDWLNEIFVMLDLPRLTKKISYKKAYLLGFSLEKIWGILRLVGEPPMTRFVANQLAHDHWFSIQSAKKDLGYEPIRDMDNSLNKSLAWLRSL
jgi:nucleoside-diphosphate-sugar epimerase